MSCKNAQGSGRKEKVVTISRGLGPVDNLLGKPIFWVFTAHVHCIVSEISPCMPKSLHVSKRFRALPLSCNTMPVSPFRWKDTISKQGLLLGIDILRYRAFSPADGRSQKVPKHDFDHFRSPERHADVCVSLASTYDFLLVFYSDLSSRWNRSHRTYQPKRHRNPLSRFSTNHRTDQHTQIDRKSVYTENHR